MLDEIRIGEGQAKVKTMIKKAIVVAVFIACLASSALAENTVESNPTDDSFVNQSNPTANFGTNTTLKVRSDSAGYARWPFLKFTVTGVSGTVTAAKLKLYSEDVTQSVPAKAVSDTSWTEGSITWNNMPAIGSTLDTKTPSAASWVEFDVASHITGNGTYSFCLQGSIDSPQVFTSKEGGTNKPVLEVTYDINDPNAPAAPTGLAATAGNAQVSLDWDDNTEPDFAGYNIYRDTTSGAPYTKIAADVTVSSYTDTGVANGITYYYVVSAVDDSNSESSYSSEASATPLSTIPPAAPTGLVTIAGNAQVLLNWDNNTEVSLAGYNVYRDTTSGGPYSKIASGIAVSAYNNTGLTNGTTYYYVVTAVDVNDNESADSSEALATPLSTLYPAGDYVLIDDFDFYVDTNGLLSTWTDGQTNGSGAVISLEDEYYGDSMRFDYNNAVSPGFSEASRSYLTGQDWMATGAKALQLLFKGEAGNSPEQMYLSIKDSNGTSATVSYPDANNLQQNSWQVWNIDLGDFTNAGVYLTNVNEIAVGLCDGGGTGTVYFDDIRLYPERCFPWYWPGADFDGDCVTNGSDLAFIARNWLLSEYTESPQPPDNNHLLIYYEFEETSGSSVSDSSTNGFTGQVVDINDNPVETGWDANGYLGRCLNFDGTFAVSIAGAAFNDVNEQLTISMWINPAVDVNADDICQVDFGTGRRQTRPDPIDVNDWLWDPNNSEWSRTRWTSEQTAAYYQGRWNHYCIVRNAPQGLIRIYHDGLLVAQQTGPLSGLNGTEAGVSEIGGWGKYGHFNGRIDEFRIYDYALEHSEVLNLAGIVEPFVQPLTPVLSPIDPYVDGRLNFPDFAILANWWLNEQLWPQ
ncbi:MAG: CBM96 family carbohydrate-binding protein [Planctomycetota bacterium]|jgi:hypothetical protein